MFKKRKEWGKSCVKDVNSPPQRDAIRQRFHGYYVSLRSQTCSMQVNSTPSISSYLTDHLQLVALKLKSITVTPFAPFGIPDATSSSSSSSN